MKTVSLYAIVFALVLGIGCGKKKKEVKIITPDEAANELFVEAVELVSDAQSKETADISAAIKKYGQALVKVRRIVSEYKKSDLAVKLVSGETLFTGKSMAQIEERVSELQREKARLAEEAKRRAEEARNSQPSTTASGGVVDGSTLIIKDEMAMQNLEGALSPFSGTAVFYYETGQKSEQVNYANGLMEGKVEGWYEDGKKFLEGTKKQGKWDGEYKEWYDNGNKKVQATYKEGNFEGKALFFYSDTEKPMWVVNYINGKKEGTATGFYEAGNKEWETTWKNGLKDGEHKEYFGDESLKSSIPYVAGKRQGAGKVWYPASPATNNKRMLAKEMNFGNDKLNGVYKTFYPHGGPMQIATFKDGKMDGEAKKYHENGQVAEVATFADGKQASFKAFDEQGQPIEKK